MSWEFRVKGYGFNLKKDGGGAQKFAIAEVEDFSELEWEQKDVEHGSEVKMSAKTRVDGPVRFVVEHKQGDQWVKHSVVQGIVQDGIATAVLRAHHPALPPLGPEPKPEALKQHAEVRFRVEEGMAKEQARAKKLIHKISVKAPKLPHPHTTIDLHKFHLEIPHPSLKKPAAETIKSKGPEGVLDARNADTLLKRGDILIKFAGENSSVTEKLIMGSEKVVQKLSGLFHDGIKKGDPTCFHAALYLGNGMTVEAHGGNISTARVGTRSFDEHAGFLFQVYRCKDQGLANEAAKVGETWGNRRMHYQVPANVPFTRANFGHFAHKQAMDFGKHATTAGGPPDFSKMFCSEFVIAIWQAAIVARQLKEKPKLDAQKIKMPLGLDLHASNASPLALDAKLVQAVEKGLWEHIAEVLVRPQEQAGGGAEQHGKDVSGKLKLVGNPTKARWPSGNSVYARNPWSLRSFDGKLYVASGNSNNKGPSPNVGPIDLWAWDPKAGKFNVEYVVADEQVDVIQKLEDGLWIPGHDSHVTGRRTSSMEKAESVPSDWAFGNTHHKKSGGVWEQLRTIKNGIHVYDVIRHSGKLFAAVSTVLGGMVARSEDSGLSWHEMPTYEKPAERTRSLFVIGGKLCASTTGGRIYVWDGNKTMHHDTSASFFPGIESSVECHVARPTAFNGKVAYIAARKLIDHDWTPEGLFVATAPDKAAAAPLPGGAMPRDFLVDGGKLYALATSMPGEKKTIVHVFETSDLSKWTELFRFESATFARSFERLDGEFWFGLGSDPELIQPETGDILRLPASALT